MSLQSPLDLMAAGGRGAYAYRRRLPGGSISLVGRRGQLRLTPTIAPLHLQKAPLLAQTRHLCLTRELAAVDDLWEALPQPRCNVPNFCVSGRRPGLTQRAARRPDKVVEAAACGVDGTQERPRLRSAGIFVSPATVPTAPLQVGVGTLFAGPRVDAVTLTVVRGWSTFVLREKGDSDRTTQGAVQGLSGLL